MDDRTKYLGGSDAAAVLGISPWRSRYRLWCEKSGAEAPPSLDGIDYVYFGTLLEPIVAAEFARRANRKVRVKRALSVHKQYPFLAGHIDRRILGARAGLEAKTSNAFDYKMWGFSTEDAEGNDAVPDHYVAQVDHYMMVENFDYFYVAALIGGNDFRWYRINRNEQREKVLLAAELEFWDMVQSGIAPEITTEHDARKRWRQSVAQKAIVVQQSDRTLLLELERLQVRGREDDKRIKALRNTLIPMFQDAEFLMENDEVIASMTNSSQERFDLEQARKEAKVNINVHVVLDAFQKRIPVRRLKVLV